MEPVFIVSSEHSMFDAPVVISLQGLKKKQLVTLHSFTTIDDGNSFESAAQYTSNDKGCIHLQNDKSVGGSYTGIEPMGLFWSMKPSSINKRQHARLVKIDVTTPLIVTIRLYDGSVSSMEEIENLRKINQLDRHELTSVSLKRWMMAPGTKRVVMTLQNDGIYGTLFLPPGDGPFPGVIALFGAFPGTFEYKAALLASHGFAALALSFVGLPGLPPFVENMNFKLKYFEKAVDIMYRHEKVNSKARIGLIGLSSSSYIVLAMGARLKKVKCVIWINGFIYPIYGRIADGKNVYDKMKTLPLQIEDIKDGSSAYKLRSMYPFYADPCHPDIDKSRIEFYNRHDVSYMFISGLSDNNVPSEHHVNQAEKLLKASKHPSYKLLRYPGAGHLIEPSFGIHHSTTELKCLVIKCTWIGVVNQSLTAKPKTIRGQSKSNS